jgi:hypothetical protein
MAYQRKRDIKLPAPYLKRIWLELSRVPDTDAARASSFSTRHAFAPREGLPECAASRARQIWSGTHRARRHDALPLLREFCASPRDFVKSLSEK